jgi:pyrroline-5-carboxylate reductase
MSTWKATGAVGIYGVGNMGEALLAGLIAAGTSPAQIYFAEKRGDRAAEIATTYGAIHKSVAEIARECSTILLVVKPQDLGALLESIKSELSPDALLISFAAGKTIAFIEAALSEGATVVRVMPNTPALIGLGAAGISPAARVSADQLAFTKNFLESCGIAVVLDESLQDAVTAVSGSGPAYFFAFVEAMVAAGVELGLSEEVASTLTIQTIVGAAGMLEKSGKSATTLRENVTSPNGTTAAALKVFSDGALAELTLKAMTAARDRSQELA